MPEYVRIPLKPKTHRKLRKKKPTGVTWDRFVRDEVLREGQSR